MLLSTTLPRSQSATILIKQEILYTLWSDTVLVGDIFQQHLFVRIYQKFTFLNDTYYNKLNERNRLIKKINE